MLVSGECCRWARVRTRFASLEVPAFNETVRDGINVADFAIRKDIATKAFHELMNFDVGDAAFPVAFPAPRVLSVVSQRDGKLHHPRWLWHGC